LILKEKQGSESTFLILNKHKACIAAGLVVVAVQKQRRSQFS